MPRFVETLVKGGSLYGVGVGCDEWRAELSDEPPHAGAIIRGNLEAQIAHQGRTYSFSYDLFEQHGVFRLSTAGRGSWSPAPGVTFPGDREGWGVIGSGTYCVERVDVLASPAADAALVGDETWFMTKEACLKHRVGPDILRCSAKRKGTTPSK